MEGEYNMGLEDLFFPQILELVKSLTVQRRVNFLGWVNSLLYLNA